MENIVYVEGGITGDYEIRIDEVRHFPESYYDMVNFIQKCPYFIRILFWTLLYYYNKRKYINSSFTLDLYKSYAN